MYYIILCEGKTDSVIINHIMSSEGFNYIKNNKNNYITFPLLKNQNIDYFKKGKDILMIWDVAGCDNLKTAIEKIEEVLEFSQITSVCIVIDRDLNSDEQLKEKVESWFKNQINIIENKWSDYFYVTSYKETKKLKFLLNIVPKGKFGAIESLIMDSIKAKSKDNNILGDRIEAFIEEIKKEDFGYLQKNREVIKAKLGCLINIIDPERTFKDIIPILNEIDWSKESIVQEHFNKLKEYY